MSSRELHDGRQDGLTPLESLRLDSVGSFAGLVRGMGRTAFGGRQLGLAFDTLLTMARDAECRVVLTLSGAMTVAKQGSIICEMVDRGLVDVIVATGALMAHGLTESIGLTHYAVSPDANDLELFEKGYNRIYDTLEMETNLNSVAELVADVLATEDPPDGVWSSASFCRAIGRRLDQQDEGPGILRSAYKRGVPVFIPAFTDSELGLDFATWAMKAAMKRLGIREGALADPQAVFTALPPFNPFVDLQHYARFAGSAKRLGIFTIGGGVPRNWSQQVAPFYDITADRLNIRLPEVRFQYGVRICPEPVHWGGLSGCTYSEGVSWGKFVAPEDGGMYAEVPADATLVWPLLMKAVFEELDRGSD
ncbi:MAG TPA: deoxyhypusine synthase family protein [Candidatus Hydrogenedentes bacterium]|mgnify:FL=1|nr:deoxyhypusine synthase family protein [Candidatus Hydrogenedentota bacterium]